MTKPSEEDASASRASSPEFYELVGRVVRQWSLLESSLFILVSALLRVDQFRARIVMKSLPVGRPQQDLVINLAETYLDPSLLPTLRSLMKRIKTQGLQRNVVAHATMFFVDGQLISFSDVLGGDKEGGLTFKAKPLSLNEVRMLLQALRDLTSELRDLEIQCRGKIHAYARIHREQQGDPKPVDGPPPPTTPEEPPPLEGSWG